MLICIHKDFVFNCVTVHQDRQLNCSSMKVRSEMEKIVNEFYENTKGTFEQLSARHIQERKQFFIRRENQRRSRFYSWSWK